MNASFVVQPTGRVEGAAEEPPSLKRRPPLLDLSNVSPTGQLCLPMDHSVQRDSIDETAPGNRVFLSGAGGACDTNLVRSLGVTHVLCCARGLPCSHPPGVLACCHLELRDNGTEHAATEFAASLPRALAFIDGALASGGAVLVHCQMGISRAPAVCLAYLLREATVTAVAEGLAHLRLIRPVVDPDEQFVAAAERLYGALA
jgi:predicted protein tyrosine phosphatase